MAFETRVAFLDYESFAKQKPRNVFRFKSTFQIVQLIHHLNFYSPKSKYDHNTNYKYYFTFKIWLVTLFS